MNIAFIWNFSRAKEIMPFWRDGLKAALETIGKHHHVGWYLENDIPLEGYYDFLLFWSDSNDPIIDKYIFYKARKGICLSTMPQNIDNLRKVDVVYCESQPVYEEVRKYGVHTVRAFGTDTSFYTPAPDTFVKDIEYFYPATVSPWKRQSTIASLGSKLLCVGTVQPDGEKELEACKQAGVKVEIGYFPAEKIRDYYRRAKNVVIPAIHGSERTCLEAMAMNIKPQVNPENIKTYSYIEEFEKSGHLFPRDFVIANYSHIQYAKQLLKGMV